jgi:hypothetical protein
VAPSAHSDMCVVPTSTAPARDGPERVQGITVDAAEVLLGDGERRPLTGADGVGYCGCPPQRTKSVASVRPKAVASQGVEPTCSATSAGSSSVRVRWTTTVSARV